MPKIAQKQVDETTFNLNSLKILKGTKDSFEVSINGTITGIGGAAKHATLDGFDAMMYLDGKTPEDSILTLPMDEIHASPAVSVVKENYLVNITNHDALKEFAVALMGEKSMGVNIKGETKVHIGKLNANVNYNERLNMTGMSILTSLAYSQGRDC